MWIHSHLKRENSTNVVIGAEGHHTIIITFQKINIVDEIHCWGRPFSSKGGTSRRVACDMLEAKNHTIWLLSKILKRVANNLANSSAVKNEKLPAMWLPKTCNCERKPFLQNVNEQNNLFSLFLFNCAYVAISFVLLLLFLGMLVSYTWLQVSGKITPAFQISLMAISLVSLIHKMNRSRWFLDLNLPISIFQLSPHRVTLSTLCRILGEERTYDGAMVFEGSSHTF